MKKQAKAQPMALLAKTFSGLEQVLAGELNALGAAGVTPMRRAVAFEGDLGMMYKTNYWCRTALSIMRHLEEFTFSNKEDFLEKVKQVPWSEYFDVKKTISVHPVAHRSELFNNTMFLAQLTKDGIADHFREKSGERPSVSNTEPDIRINVYVNQEKCSLSLDSSGDALFKRGYRKATGGAPINEILAAALIILSGWDKTSTFLDPMCGSGTFSIEAGMMAANMAPAMHRKTFGFSHWKDFDPELLANLQQEAREMVTPVKGKILASDIHGKTLDIARQNVMEAGLMGQIRVQRNDFFNFTPPPENGWVILNPPYGHRIQQKDLPEFYQKIGDTLKQKFAGYKAGLFSAELEAMKKVGLKPSAKFRLYNGPLESLFLVYELFEGKHKEHVAKTRPKRPRIKREN